jgi:2-methylcitrate dehydratase PrpD
MMDKNFTDILIDDLYSQANEPMPQAVLTQAKKCVLDYLGAGWRAP